MLKSKTKKDGGSYHYSYEKSQYGGGGIARELIQNVPKSLMIEKLHDATPVFLV